MSRRNPYFKFQQFTVYHDKCAMKVGTDGTVLGAWVDVSDAHFALDVGAGTGLLALMMAQKNKNLIVDAIDIEDGAVLQAGENIERSPFADRINVEQIALQDFNGERLYDVIVSNPPFFTETLKSPDKQRAVARHADSLPAEDLIRFSADRLTEKGSLSVIYPFEYKSMVLELGVKYKLYPKRITTLYSTPQSEPKRILIELSKIEGEIKEDNLIIELERHVYSGEFKELVRDFYLREIAKNK